jgi:hypothetical protein
MTWRNRDGGYEVFFNRDERRSRQRASPAASRVSGSTRYLAPADGDFGGSWIAVNECGMTLALENGYVDADDSLREPEDGFTSRGLLLTELIGCASVERVLDRLETMSLGPYRSFLLTIFSADGNGVLARWMRGRLRLDHGIDGLMPIVSSSFETEAVCRTRRAVFSGMIGDGGIGSTGLHLAFHASHSPERGPSSPCMHRPEARTVSFSHIEVDPQEVRFHYVGHSPCRGLSGGPPLALPRRASLPNP